MGTDTLTKLILTPLAPRVGVTHETDEGYDLQSSLMVSHRTGLPLASVAQRLVSADGSYATYGDTASPSPAKHHLEEVSDCIQHLDGQDFPKPLVHLIDREGDSIRYIRRWDAAGSRWLVRVKDNPKLDYAGKPTACKAVAQELAFSKTRQVSYHARPIGSGWPLWPSPNACSS